MTNHLTPTPVRDLYRTPDAYLDEFAATLRRCLDELPGCWSVTERRQLLRDLSRVTAEQLARQKTRRRR